MAKKNEPLNLTGPLLAISRRAQERTLRSVEELPEDERDLYDALQSALDRARQLGLAGTAMLVEAAAVKQLSEAGTALKRARTGRDEEKCNHSDDANLH